MMTTIERARNYISKCPHAVSGSCGHNQTFAVACVLVHGFELPDADAYQLLSEYNQSCQPPWSEKELVHKIKSAAAATHSKPRGHLLGATGYVKAEVDYYRPATKLPVTKAQSKPYNPQNRVPLPEPLDDSCRRFILAAFNIGENIGMADAVLSPDRRSTPQGGGTVLARQDWIQKLDAVDGDPNKIFTNQKCGAFIRINPMKPGGKSDADVECYRHALVEFDQLSVDDQFSIIKQSQLPCTAVLHSGGKSIHAWVRIDAKDREEYNTRVSWLYEHFKQYGIDPKNKNPSRFSRLPGMKRGESEQKLLELNVGAESWLAWQSQKEQEVLGELVTIRDILAYDPDKDPSSVLGRRWLCRGGSCLWVGQSGVGKSSLAIQAAIAWAGGLSFFGLKSTYDKPLKSLIIQAENDLGDVAEMVQGVSEGITEENGYTPQQITAMANLVPDNIAIVRNQTHTGRDFCDTLRRLIEIHKPDLVWVDPLLAFFGDDISNQKACSQFLRNWLNPIIESSGVVLMIMHHTNKPPSDGKSKSSWTRNDYSYAGSGSAELTNWARAVVVLREMPDKTYKLSFTKRGARAGVRDLDAIFTRDLCLTHADHGIRWIQIDTPEEEEKKPNNRPKTTIPESVVARAFAVWTSKSDGASRIAKALNLSREAVAKRWLELSPLLTPDNQENPRVWVYGNQQLNTI